MRFVKGSPEFEYNVDAMHDLEDLVPMTRPERKLLHYWVVFGNDIYTNPWRIFEPDGSPMSFLKALRIRQGYSHGPWDSWEYADCIIAGNPGFFAIRFKKRCPVISHPETQP